MATGAGGQVGDLAYPPDGVETARQRGRPTLTTTAAGQLLGQTAAQVRAAINRGDLPGGAEPRPRRPRYYVYCDVPPLLLSANEETTNWLRGRVSALETANLLLLQSEAELREAGAAAERTQSLLRQAEQQRSEEVKHLRLADAAKAEALATLVLPQDAAGAED